MTHTHKPKILDTDAQASLPKLPVPDLEDTCRRYLAALKELQDPDEHAATQRAVDEFLKGDGPRIQAKLRDWAAAKDSYIEEFWYESYLSHSDPVVLALNPFFVLEDDPTPSRGTQLPRAASLIISSLGFVHDLREGLLKPDSVRGKPLDMDQYTRLFGTARVPTARGCRMDVAEGSRHIVVIRRGQFYYFDVLDSENRPVLTEREILRNLEAICADAETVPLNEVASSSMGVLTTENRKVWNRMRNLLCNNDSNKECLQVVDDALFVVCLDDVSPENVGELCSNFLCGTYQLSNGVQVGTCTNRWYDKLQIIVCANGTAGINFEHTGVDGHTVLRFAADVFTEGLMLMARSINPAAPTLFHAKLSPHAKSYKPSKHAPTNGSKSHGELQRKEDIDTNPKKLEWQLIPELRAGIRFAERRISDLICQNDCQELEFKGYGKEFITRHGFSPDAYVQMAFQAAYFGLYGRTECTYEPAMTKAFLHGRTEAIRTVQTPSVTFTKTFFSEASVDQKIDALRKACTHHVKLTRECSSGQGQDRHLYAIYCLLQREINESSQSPSPAGTPDPNGKTQATANSYTQDGAANANGELTVDPAAFPKSLPSIFTDHGWSILNTSIMSTSNCGNPALRLFGFGPVAADGYGIGYIIKDDGISVVASSKHLQTRRFLDTLKQYFIDAQRMIIQLHRQANERPKPLEPTSTHARKSSRGTKDHMKALEESKAKIIVKRAGSQVLIAPQDDADGIEGEEVDLDLLTSGYSFFDSGDVESLNPQRRRPTVGRTLRLAEY
ncbi:hypothetical protein M408DRAFT_329582 [Serendipita vermifera MAFF 305830]|uniref:Choline/carnitine acyltransferase domain-containing protein n=1 Tax=Serendipita vermifera MAFF 305830 TaxID=933852 RepID=A0A0C3B7Y3_SERVB|nr:hypothetical protein M408DRAFT_329582 [Serendipita vermifera MAFF 305830]